MCGLHLPALQARVPIPAAHAHDSVELRQPSSVCYCVGDLDGLYVHPSGHFLVSHSRTLVESLVRERQYRASAECILLPAVAFDHQLHIVSSRSNRGPAWRLIESQVWPSASRRCLGLRSRSPCTVATGRLHPQGCRATLRRSLHARVPRELLHRTF